MDRGGFAEGYSGMRRGGGTLAFRNDVKTMRISTRLLRVLFGAVAPFALFVGSGSNSAEGEAPEGGYVEQADLAAVIKSRNVDQILETLNKVKVMSYQGQILPYVLDLWNLRQDKYADLPWDVLSLDIVRLDIGNVLAQASRNGRIDVDSDAIHDFAYRLVRSADVDVASEAVWTLGIFDRSEDVAEIKSIALTAHRKLFHVAVISLTDMCNEAAAKALTELESASLTPDEFAYLIETTQKSAEFKERTGRCKTSGQGQ